MTSKSKDFTADQAAVLLERLNAAAASFSPPEPLVVEELVMASGKGHQVVYEDAECIIIMG